MTLVANRKKLAGMLCAFVVWGVLLLPLLAQASPVENIEVEYGHLQVHIEPAEAALDGAKWRLLDDAWNDSGDVLSELEVGDHLIEFALIPGYQPPAIERVTVNEGGAVVTVHYRHLAGSLEVSLSPIEAISAGARWRIDGGAWQQSDAVLDDIEEGLHAVEFKVLEQWYSPPRETVWVYDSRLSVTAGSYAPLVGSLSLTLSPLEAIAEGAMWRIQDDIWQKSGDLLEYLPIGDYTVEFSDVAGWNTPQTQQVTVSEPLIQSSADYVRK